jgi:hypothetical protein
LHTLVGSRVAQLSVLVASTLCISRALHTKAIAGLAVLASWALSVCLAAIVDNVMRMRVVLLRGPTAPPQQDQNESDEDNTDNDDGIPVVPKDLAIRGTLRSLRACRLCTTYLRHLNNINFSRSFFFKLCVDFFVSLTDIS